VKTLLASEEIFTSPLETALAGFASELLQRKFSIELDPTLGDAILDRLLHNAYRINLKGESMRKRHAQLTSADSAE
jgi:DNA replication protein DnaC